VPLEDYVRKISHKRFEPQGHTKNPDIRIAKSLIDYIFRWLGITFLPGYKEATLGVPLGDERAGSSSTPAPDDETAETQPRPVAKKADGRPAGQEAKSSQKTGHAMPGPDGNAGPERAGSSPSPANPQSSVTTAAKPKSNGHANGHSNGNGNGNGATLYSPKLLERAGVMPKTDAASPSVRSEQFAGFQVDAPACDGCGAITVRNGNCYLCHNCGNSMGCS
jgi:ribonucleoside-diphosphate reductase alpha chain